MAWDRNDWIAAALITFLLVLGSIVAAMLLGWIPSVDKIFDFEGSSETLSIFQLIR